jgi:endonuclease/exonuclease/phosphatase family metal-dependent hydrolase
MARILTYNVHRCVGVDGRLDVGRVAEVIAAQQPDIVALQELDVRRARTGGVDQAHRLAQRLGMAFHFNAAFRVEEEEYGDAVLTALPERLVKAGGLPGYWRIPQLEQQIQAACLAGEQWLGAIAGRAPTMVVGDFNATARTVAYRALSAGLTEARRGQRRWRGVRTFPSSLPMLAIDHVFASPGVVVDDVRAPSDPLSRVASDHLPLVVDFHLARA